MPSGPDVLVLGATGGQGGAVVAVLLARGVRIRALVRDPSSPRAAALTCVGVKVVAGSFTDASTLRAAMTGVSAAFALTTPFEAGPDAETAQGMTIIAAAKQSRLPFLVFSSVAGALHHTGVPHFDSKAAVEQELDKQRLPHAVLAPTFFYDNLTGDVLDRTATTLNLPLRAGTPLQQLARGTFGQIAASVLLAPQQWSGQRIELAEDAPTGEQMAAVLSRRRSRAVRYVPAAASSAGPVGSDMRAMWTFLDEFGYQVDIPALRRSFPDVTWTSFTQWADTTLDRPAKTTDTAASA